MGLAVGDVIGPLPVEDCDTGEPASIDVTCGASAAWIFAAHTHCPTCKATAGFTDEVAAMMSDRNVAIIHTVYDDSGVSCAAWRQAYALSGLSNVRVFRDPGGAVWAKLKTSNYTAPSAFLDRNRVITHKAHGLDREAVLTMLEEALAK